MTLNRIRATLLALMSFCFSVANGETLVSVRKPEAVSPLWYQKMQDLANQNQASNIIALFSYSGFVDQGQVWALQYGSPLRWTVFYVKPGSKELDSQRSIENKDMDPTLSVIKASEGLKHLERLAMDGIEFQFVWLERVSGQLKIKHSIYMNNPGLDPSDKPYLDLIKGLQLLSLARL